MSTRSQARRAAPMVAFSGPSGAGKTRLLTRLIALLSDRGFRVGAIKHSSHAHTFDIRGSDSDRLRRAGALAVAVQGSTALALHAPALPRPEALAALLGPVDLVLVEGFKRAPLPRIELHREVVNAAFLCARDRHVVAVVSDVPPPVDVPWFKARQVEAVADFLLEHLRLPARRPSASVGTRAATRRLRRHRPHPGVASDLGD